MKMTTKWKAAVYVRLSVDDGSGFSESMSIINQKKMISEWAKNQIDISIENFYVDDGYSGTNFERPAFKSMMYDIYNGGVNCVIVKDLSRLGRNSNRVGQLVDEDFPKLGVRFVAINDSIDTSGLVDDNEITGFKLVCNEFYVKDISKKIRSALKASAQSGNYLGAVAPFGYFKDEKDYHKLVIDPIASKIVVKIFNDYIDGKSGRQIADELNAAQVLTPSNYKRQSSGKEIDETKVWSSSVVLQLINNEVYYGRLVYHKREKLSYKLKYRRVTDKSEWIVVENTHPRIINEFTELLIKKKQEEKVNTRNRLNKQGKKIPVLFSGLLYCADCGSKMAATTKREKRCYRCSKYNISGSSACSTHMIYEQDLLMSVMNEIDDFYKQIIDNENLFVKKKLEEYYSYRTSEINSAQLRLTKINREISETENSIFELYRDNKNGEIPGVTFSVLLKKYNDILKELLQNKEKCNNIINDISFSENHITQWVSCVKQIRNSKPSANLLAKIIDKIYVYDTSSKNRVKIIYKIQQNECFDENTLITSFGA